jgi:hypothetical protein
MNSVTVMPAELWHRTPDVNRRLPAACPLDPAAACEEPDIMAARHLVDLSVAV